MYQHRLRIVLDCDNPFGLSGALALMSPPQVDPALESVGRSAIIALADHQYTLAMIGLTCVYELQVSRKGHVTGHFQMK
jgi:hypothetical protein